MLFCRATQRRNRTKKLHADMHRQFSELASDDVWIAETVERFTRVSDQALSPKELKGIIERMGAMTGGTTTALRNNFVEDLIASAEMRT